MSDQDADTGELQDADQERQRAVRLLQGYIWHPRELELDLSDYLPAVVGEDIHVLFDAMPAAPFTFFDDGTMTATQQFYQLTVLTFVGSEVNPSGRVPWLAEELQRRLETTPPGVGWQVFEDLRDLS